MNKKSCWTVWWKVWCFNWSHIIWPNLLSNCWIESGENQKSRVTTNIELWWNFLRFFNVYKSQATKTIGNFDIFSSVTNNSSFTINQRWRDCHDNTKRRKNYKYHVELLKIQRKLDEPKVVSQIYRNFISQSITYRKSDDCRTFEKVCCATSCNKSFVSWHLTRDKLWKIRLLFDIKSYRKTCGSASSEWWLTVGDDLINTTCIVSSVVGITENNWISSASDVLSQIVQACATSSAEKSWVDGFDVEQNSTSMITSRSWTSAVKEKLK